MNINTRVRSYGSLHVNSEGEPLIQPIEDYSADTIDVIQPAGNGHHRGGNNAHEKNFHGDVESQGSSEDDLPVKDRLRNCCKSTFTLQNALGKLPIVTWLPKYRCDTFQSDLIAGLTVGLTVIPQGLAYAQIAGLSPEYGLYSAFMGCFVYALLGTSKDITLGPTAIMSLMTAEFGSSKSPCLKYDMDNACEARDPTLAILLTLLSGVIELTMGVLQLGILVNYISYPVINAFTSAAAISIAVGQLKTVLGLKDVSREFLHQVYDICRKIPETRKWDMTMGIIAIIACVLLKKLRTIKYRGDDDPNHEVSIPVKILRKLIWLCGTGANAIVVIVSAAVVAIVESQGVDIEEHISVTGNITGGMPSFKPPAFEIRHDNETMSTSEVFSTLGAGIGIVPLLALVETMAIGKAFARANNYKIQPTQELLAIGTANIVSSFVSSYPITGSFSRTAVNSQSGVRTPLGGVWTGALVILALIVLTPYFYYIPKAALAGVIIAAVVQMVDYQIVKKLWFANKLDLIPLFVTFIGSLTIGIEYGILIGIGVSLLMLLYPIARPKVKYTLVSGALIVTPSQGVNFPAAEHIEIKAMEKAKVDGKMRHIILNMEHLSDLDYTAIQSVKSLLADCEMSGMRLVLVGGMTAVREKLQTSNVKNLTHVDTISEALSELSLQAVDDVAVRGDEVDPFISRL